MIKIFFGSPGCGKSTLAARFSVKLKKKYEHIYSNFPIKGAILIDSKDLGVYDFRNCLILLDEASIDFNNRLYKSMSKECISYLKLHRHYKADIFIWSQSYDDMDITMRRLADHLYLQKRSIIPKMFRYKEIRKRIGIDEQTKQIIDEYAFVPFSSRFFFGFRWWKYFDSYTTPPLPAFPLNEEAQASTERSEESTKSLVRKLFLAQSAKR